VAAGNSFEPEIHAGLAEAIEVLPAHEANDANWPYAEVDW
jgi:hypothetical protein